MIAIFLGLIVVGAFCLAGLNHADIRRQEVKRLRRENQSHTDLQARLVHLCIQHAQVDPIFPTIVLDEIAHARKDDLP